MAPFFYIAAGVAVAGAALAVTRLDAVHALLYLIASLLGVAVVFYTLGAPLVAALEVIIYAGAIMVLFLFVVMMLNLGAESARHERHLLPPRQWIGPGILVGLLAVEFGALLWLTETSGQPNVMPIGVAGATDPVAVGATLMGPYMLGVELASFLLLAAIAGALHLGRRRQFALPAEASSLPERTPVAFQVGEPPRGYRL